ncbi:hypothetical protein EDB86DRAFT_2929945 [Lactarius hatsudake]|nr:hypothetical protein EDB86DRAFT_2929945 [Lactarius hatsudake]
MSPVDSSAADSLVNAAKTVREVGAKRDSEVLVEADTSNAVQPKSTKKQKRDVPAEAAAEEKKTGVVSEPPQEPPSVSKEKSETQTSSRELAREEHKDEKKSKKRKRKEGDGDGPNDAIEQTDTQLEATSLHLNDKSQDENKAKKRKHREKRDDGSQSKQSDVAGEETAQGLATGAEEVKEREKKKKKGKDKKAGAEEKALAVEKPKKKRKKSESES